MVLPNFLEYRSTVEKMTPGKRVEEILALSASDAFSPEVRIRMNIIKDVMATNVG